MEPQLFVFYLPLRHQIAVTHDDAQVVVELVGNSTCQMAYRFHLLSLMQFVFCALTHADVPENDRVEPFRAGLYLRDRGFDRKVFPIGSYSHQRSGRFQRAAGNACLSEAPDVFPMSIAELPWYEPIDSLPNGLGCWAAEDFFCGSVEDDNLLIVIDCNDGIHRRTDYS